MFLHCVQSVLAVRRDDDERGEVTSRKHRLADCASLWLEANPGVIGFSFPVWLLLSMFPWHHLTSAHLYKHLHMFNSCLCLNSSCCTQSIREWLTCFPLILISSSSWIFHPPVFRLQSEKGPYEVNTHEGGRHQRWNVIVVYWPLLLWKCTTHWSWDPDPHFWTQ